MRCWARTAPARSTLVKCIMGFYRADEGTVRLERQGDQHLQPAGRARQRHRHGLPALHAGAIADGGREPRHQPRRRAGRHQLERGEAAARGVPRQDAVPRAARHADLVAGRGREAEARDPQAALPRPALHDPGRADLGAHPVRGRRDAGPAARMALAKDITVAHHHPQVPRGDGVCRRGDGAAARQADRRRQGRRADHPGHGAHDDRRQPIREHRARARSTRTSKVVLDLSGLYARRRRGAARPSTR